MPTINLDMDGVLADFNRAARALNAANPNQESVLVNTPNLYRNLPKMPQADLLMLAAQCFVTELGWNCRALTAIPKNHILPDVIQDKVEWMREFYPDVRITFGPYAEDKQNHAQPGDILVDDKLINCEQWRTQGGVAFHVGEDYNKTIQELKQYFITVRRTSTVAQAYTKIQHSEPDNTTVTDTAEE